MSLSRLLPVFAVALFVLPLGGCATGNSPTAPSTATSSPSAASQVSARDRDYQQALLACLQDAGWDVEIDTDGGIYVPGGIPNAQFSDYLEAAATCEEHLNASIPQLADLSSGQWSQLYGLEVATAECLRAAGIDVPAAPSEQSFIERYQGSDPWTSYGFVGAVDESTWARLNSSCPQPAL